MEEQIRESPLAKFLEGRGVGSCGETLDEILSLDDQMLEARHNYIQWLFPLDVPSEAVRDAPCLTAQDVNYVRASSLAHQNVMAAAHRMRAFYARNSHWLRPYDHNHLRITRIIRSLRLLVGDTEAEEFKAFVLARVASAGRPVNARSLEFWESA
ncbi:MAG TPA: opioid growth factor receptor-related protein [Allosphingosinicella sp.]|jgi:hypothetical protein